MICVPTPRACNRALAIHSCCSRPNLDRSTQWRFSDHWVVNRPDPHAIDRRYSVRLGTCPLRRLFVAVYNAGKLPAAAVVYLSFGSNGLSSEM